MNDLETSLNDITEERYPEIARQITKLHYKEIDDELERQASLYSWYHGLLALCKSKVRKVEADIGRAEDNREDYGVLRKVTPRI